MKCITIAKITGISTVMVGCLFANSLIKPKYSTQEVKSNPTEIRQEPAKTPLNDSTTLAAMFTLGLLSTGAFVQKALKK